MHAGGSIPCGSGTASTGNGLVVPESLDLVGAGLIATEAKSQVVSVALGGGAGFESAEDNVGDALALEESVSGFQRKRTSRGG